jgi:hypothetical protein
MVWWVEHKHCIFHIAKTVYEHIRQLVKDNTAWKKLHGEFWQWPSCYQRLKSDAPSTIVTKVLPKLTPFAGQLLCAKAAQLMQYHVEKSMTGTRTTCQTLCTMSSPGRMMGMAPIPRQRSSRTQTDCLQSAATWTTIVSGVVAAPLLCGGCPESKKPVTMAVVSSEPENRRTENTKR